HDRLLHGRAGGAAAVVDAAEELELADAEIARDLDLGIAVHRERDHALDLGRLDGGVAQGGFDGLHRQVQLAPARVLRELGGADAGDRGGVPQRVLGHGSVSSTVPVTWSPALLAPRTATSTTPPCLRVTFPVIRMVSSG